MRELFDVRWGAVPGSLLDGEVAPFGKGRIAGIAQPGPSRRLLGPDQRIDPRLQLVMAAHHHMIEIAV